MCYEVIFQSNSSKLNLTSPLSSPVKAIRVDKVKSLYNFVIMFYFSNLYFSMIKQVLATYQIQYRHYPLLFQLLESARLFYV